MIRIVIVASIRLYREGLADLISRQDGLCVSGALPDLHDAEEHLKALAPDVVLLDMATAESDGTARALRLTETAVPIVSDRHRRFRRRGARLRRTGGRGLRHARGFD